VVLTAAVRAAGLQGEPAALVAFVVARLPEALLELLLDGPEHVDIDEAVPLGLHANRVLLPRPRILNEADEAGVGQEVLDAAMPQLARRGPRTPASVSMSPTASSDAPARIRFAHACQ
jgi:hypothetical protein